MVDAERDLPGELLTPTVLVGLGVAALRAVLTIDWGVRTFQRESA